MEIFSALQALCAGNSQVTGEFPAQRPVTWGFDVFFNLRLKNGLVNNREAGDLGRHSADCDVTVMAYRYGCAMILWSSPCPIAYITGTVIVFDARKYI